MRWPTLHQAHYLLFASQHLAYSDVIAFYGGDIARGHQFPYLQQPLEYPVLTGMQLWLTGFVPRVEGYFLVNALLLCGCLAGCFAILSRLGPRVRPARFALAPGLALYGVQNWDAVALLCLVAACWGAAEDQWIFAGACLAVGTSAKFFPGFAFPVFLAYSLRAPVLQRHAVGLGVSLRGLSVPLKTRCFLAGFALMLIALNLPLALLSWDGWSHWIVVQAQRGANLDAVWTHIPWIADALSRRLATSLIVGGLAWTALEVWLGGRYEVGVLLCLLVFMLFTRDYSPQYDLWILPLLAILACPVWLWSCFVLADGVYDFSIFHFYAVYASGQRGEALAHAATLAGGSVWGREAVLALLTVWGWTRLHAPQPVS